MNPWMMEFADHPRQGVKDEPVLWHASDQVVMPPPSLNCTETLPAITRSTSRYVFPSVDHYCASSNPSSYLRRWCFLFHAASKLGSGRGQFCDYTCRLAVRDTPHHRLQHSATMHPRCRLAGLSIVLDSVFPHPARQPLCRPASSRGVEE